MAWKAGIMSIREAVLSDLEKIQDLNQQIFLAEMEVGGRGWNPEYPYQQKAIDGFKQSIRKEGGYAAFVFEVDGDVVAYMTLLFKPAAQIIHRVGIDLAEINTFCVDKNFRGRGIGKQMLAKAEDWAKEKGANQMSVGTGAANKAARGLYESFGFEGFEVTYEMAL